MAKPTRLPLAIVVAVVAVVVVVVVAQNGDRSFRFRRAPSLLTGTIVRFLFVWFCFVLFF